MANLLLLSHSQLAESIYETVKLIMGKPSDSVSYITLPYGQDLQAYQAEIEAHVEKAKDAIRRGVPIITDTQMGKAGINKKRLAEYDSEVLCFMSDEDVAEMAKKNGTTRAVASMDKAAALGREAIFAVGNAPTALVRLYELIKEGKINPELIIAVPVGFVNVVQSKELILSLEDTPSIVARGRKGGSNIAACICNALLYQM